jgi:hypothetical protein
VFYSRVVHLTLRETAAFQVAPEVVWALLVDIDSMPLFAGFGPVPGIERACWVEGDGYREGAVREVCNRDGSRHREKVVAAIAPTLLEDRIYGFTSPLRLLAREARDRFELGAHGSGTMLTRTFTLELRSPLVWPAAALLGLFLRKALSRHHRAMRNELAQR